LAAETTIPGIVWFVVIVGGAITIAFSSFLGAPSVGMHLSMCCLLAVSGALVLVLIIALSNPFRGDFRVSTAPFDYASEKHPDNVAATGCGQSRGKSSQAPGGSRPARARGWRIKA